MIKDLVSALDYTLCAESALALFFVTFAGIVYASMRLSNRAVEQFAAIPMADDSEVARDE